MIIFLNLINEFLLNFLDPSIPLSFWFDNRLIGKLTTNENFPYFLLDRGMSGGLLEASGFALRGRLVDQGLQLSAADRMDPLNSIFVPLASTGSQTDRQAARPSNFVSLLLFIDSSYPNDAVVIHLSGVY